MKRGLVDSAFTLIAGILPMILMRNTMALFVSVPVILYALANLIANAVMIRKKYTESQ